MTKGAAAQKRITDKFDNKEEHNLRVPDRDISLRNHLLVNFPEINVFIGTLNQGIFEDSPTNKIVAFYSQLHPRRAESAS